MVLTGKAKEDFIKYASYNYGEDSVDLNMMREVMRNALIIEWFDSVGSIIHTSYDIIYKKWGYEIFNCFIYNNNDDDFYIPMIHNVFNSRQEATKHAIIKANEIYNEQQQEK